MMTTKQWLYVGAAAVVIMAAAYYLTDDKPAKKDKPAPAAKAPRVGTGATEGRTAEGLEDS